jgi:hypothetical protein
MKTQTATAPATATATDAKVEVIRPLSVIESLFTIEGDRVTIPKGLDVSPAEIGAFIADRDEKSRTYGGQARWTWYAVGLLPDATAKREAIKAALVGTAKEPGKMSQSAFYQLSSEAETLCPLIIAEGIKSPLSLVKDAKAALLVNEKTGRLAPMKDQGKAAKALIPLLKAGTVTQAGIRAIRKEHATPTAPKGPKASTTPPANEADKAAIAFGLALGQAKAVQTYVTANKLSGKDRDQFVNIVTDICRQMGLVIAN